MIRDFVILALWLFLNAYVSSLLTSFNLIIMTKQISKLAIFFCVISLLCLSAKCNNNKNPLPQNSPKITFDLDQIGKDGLGTQAGSKVAIDYEYCIPAEEKYAAIVRKIDPQLKIMKSSRGRIGCTKSQWLCMGNTHQKDWRKILIQLAELDFVAQIDRTFFE